MKTIKIYKNQRKIVKSMKYNENLQWTRQKPAWNRAKDSGEQVESYRPKHPCPEIDENRGKFIKFTKSIKSMKISELLDEIRSKTSSENKKPAWHQATVSISATSQILPS